MLYRLETLLVGCFLDDYGDDNGDCNGFDGVENKDCVKLIFLFFSFFLLFYFLLFKLFLFISML